jgi:hypothetical protein
MAALGYAGQRVRVRQKVPLYQCIPVASPAYILDPDSDFGKIDSPLIDGCINKDY